MPALSIQPYNWWQPTDWCSALNDFLLYNLYDIENKVFTCRNKYYRVNETGPVESLLKLWGSENDISVRAEADGALRALSSRLDTAKRSLMNVDGFPVFITTIQVPSKEFSYGVVARNLSAKQSRGIFSCIWSRFIQFSIFW